MPRTPLAALAALVLAGALATTACSAEDGGKPSVVAALYPMEFVARTVGGPDVAVTNLAKPGVEPHDLELSPQQVAEVAKADLVLYLAGFQPAVDDAVEQQAKDKSLDAAAAVPLADATEEEEGGHGSEEHANEGKDLHVWLDPDRLATIAGKVADRLAKLDSAHADGFRGRAAALRTQLTELDQQYKSGLASCQRTEIVVSHAAFGYLTSRYGLTQIPIAGLTPEAEPSAERLAEIAKLAREKKVTVIFFETLASPKLAETLAREVGVKTEVLDPIEGLTPGSGDNYFSLMRANLTKLRGALGCT